MKVHEHYMRMALQQALQAMEEEEVPVGAVIVHGQRVVAAATHPVFSATAPGLVASGKM